MLAWLFEWALPWLSFYPALYISTWSCTSLQGTFNTPYFYHPVSWFHILHLSVSDTDVFCPFPLSLSLSLSSSHTHTLSLSISIYIYLSSSHTHAQSLYLSHYIFLSLHHTHTQFPLLNTHCPSYHGDYPINGVFCASSASFLIYCSRHTAANSSEDWLVPRQPRWERRWHWDDTETPWQWSPWETLQVEWRRVAAWSL